MSASRTPDPPRLPRGVHRCPKCGDILLDLTDDSDRKRGVCSWQCSDPDCGCRFEEPCASPAKGGAEKVVLTEAQHRALLKALEMPDCKDCPTKPSCTCKGECLVKAHAEMQAVRGRFRWPRRRHHAKPEPCTCCRGVCDCPHVLTCDHFVRLPVPWTREELAEYLWLKLPQFFADPEELPPVPALALTRLARVAEMDRRQTLGYCLHRLDDVWQDGPDTVAIALNKDGAEMIVVASWHEDEPLVVRTRDEILSKASKTYAARLKAAKGGAQ